MSKLDEKIKSYQEAFRNKVPVATQEVMLKATQTLVEQNISKNALKVGAQVHPFALPNALNNQVSLKDELEKNDFVVLNFYRGGWCPYCNLELKEFQGILGELNELNSSLIAISPQTPDASLSTQEKNELSFEVLSDEKNVIAKEFGLVFSLADELKPIYESFKINLPTSNDDDSYEIPMPATYVLDKKGVVIFAFIDEDYTKRCEPQLILDIIQKNKS
ncbi:alkyl hydroperoxide reductase [Arcobacter sp. 31_11_sub10_T18]|nr:alkyl hydroperoxide reductase [Arcobacter sp. 31_11_sub10_T18]